jgi:hypothetical protein
LPEANSKIIFEDFLSVFPLGKTSFEVHTIAYGQEKQRNIKGKHNKKPNRILELASNAG